MTWAGMVYLLMTIGMFAVFAAIVIWTFSGKRKERLEAPRERMLEPDEKPAEKSDDKEGK